MLIQNKHYLTIWLDHEDRLTIIDQTVLPHKFKLIHLDTLDQVCHAISSMQVRGAGLIGVTTAYGVYVAAKKFGTTNSLSWQDYMQDAHAKLQATRPTAKNLTFALDEMLPLWLGKTREECLNTIRQKALQIAADDIEYAKNIGRFGKEIIADIYAKKQSQVNILTHCNAGWLAFTDYGSALSPVYTAFEADIPLHVWVDETRPRNQGASLTAWELKEQGVEHSLIADNTGGHLMQNGFVDMVIVGADRVTRNGDVANKIGTYLKALAAYDNNIPFYVALPSSTFDFSINDGKKIPIEQRDATEVNYIQGLLETTKELVEVRISPENTKAANWAFDVTPARLISGLITERGICKASEEAILELFPEAKAFI